MTEAHFIRHSKAQYRPYAEALAGDKPEGPFDPKAQHGRDLTPVGRELAQRESAKFFAGLNVADDELFFVSSNEARAIETAGIYRGKAKELGFAVIKPERSKSKLADELTGGEVRVMEALSLSPENMLWFTLFEGERPVVNWEAVDPGIKTKWESARAIIEANNQGRWGTNFLMYSEQFKADTPEFKSAEQQYHGRFRRLLKLLNWADKRLRTETEKKKNVKILAFGHEDYVVHFLQKEFTAEGINNCEAIKFDVTDSGNIGAEFRGQRKESVQADVI